MKDKLLSAAGALLYIVLFFDFIGGEIHAFKKHGAADGFIGAFIFPWGMYRGVESLWHDDFSGVDWEKKGKSDIRSCIYFLMRENSPDTDIPAFNKELEEFSISINKYPKDKIQFLEAGTREYSAFLESSLQSIISSLEKCKHTSIYELELSENTNKIIDRLSRYDLKEDANTEIKSWDVIGRKLNELNLRAIKDDDKSPLNIFENNLRNASREHSVRSKRIFKSLFNEEI